MVLDNVGIEPVRDMRKVAGPHQPIDLIASQVLGLDQEDCQEPGVNIAGVPEREGQLVVGLYLRGKLPEVAQLNAELIVTGAVLFVMRTNLFVAESLELSESFFESHGHVSIRRLVFQG